MQQLIAQAEECLKGLNSGKDGEKINALIEALKGLTSALETKAALLEQGNITGADQVDQQIDAQERQLQDAVDQSLPQISGAIASVGGRSAITDRAGNYSIGNVPFGRHQVKVARRGYSGEARTVDVRVVAANVNFDLRPAGSGADSTASKNSRMKPRGESGSEKRMYEPGQLKGRVMDEKTGRPVSGARVTIQGRSDTTDQAGNYLVTDVPPGRNQSVLPAEATRVKGTLWRLKRAVLQDKTFS